MKKLPQLTVTNYKYLLASTPGFLVSTFKGSDDSLTASITYPGPDNLYENSYQVYGSIKGMDSTEYIISQSNVQYNVVLLIEYDTNLLPNTQVVDNTGNMLNREITPETERYVIVLPRYCS